MAASPREPSGPAACSPIAAAATPVEPASEMNAIAHACSTRSAGSARWLRAQARYLAPFGSLISTRSIPCGSRLVTRPAGGASAGDGTARSAGHWYSGLGSSRWNDAVIVMTTRSPCETVT
jgi:hypothetical protein